MSRNIAQVIIAAGLTEEQVESIVNLGAESEVELRELTEEDLIGLGVPKLKARAALRAWGAFAAISSTTPEFTVRIDPFELGRNRRGHPLVHFLIRHFKASEISSAATRMGLELPETTNESLCKCAYSFVDLLQKADMLGKVHCWRALSIEKRDLTGQIAKLAEKYGVNLSL